MRMADSPVLVSVPDSVLLVILPHPLGLQGRASASVPAGGSIAEILAQAGLDFLLCPNLAVALDLDGSPVLREMWDTAQPRAGQTIMLRALPGKSGNQEIQTVVMVAAMVVAMWAGPAAAGAMGLTQTVGGVTSLTTMGMFASAAVSTGIMVGSQYLAQAIAPIKPPKNQPGLESSNVYSGGAQKNRYMPGGRLPMVLGGPIRIWPDYLIKPYTSLSGNDSYLHMMVGLCGPATLSDIRLGDTSIANISEAQIVVWSNSEASEPDLTGIIDRAVVKEESVSINLVYGASVTRSFPDIEELEFDYHFPLGLGSRGTRNQSNIYTLAVYVGVQYRLSGSSTWVNAQTHYTGTFSSQDCEDSDMGEYKDLWTCETNPYSQVPGLWTGPVTAHGNTASPFFRTYAIKFPSKGNYEVRWSRRKHPTEEDGADLNAIVVTALRGKSNIGQSPVRWDQLPPIAGMAMKIKYTGAVSGILDQLNCLATGHGYIPDVVNGGYTTGPIVYPPDAYLWAMCGPHARRPLSFDRVDTDTMASWRDCCEENDLKISAVIDYSPSLSEALADIASVGRASPGMRDNLHTVVVDRPQDAPVQLINAANSAGLRVSKVMKGAPHAVRVKFRNADADFEWDTRTVYNDGYSEGNATQIEDIELWGVTDADQAWKAGRFWLADIKLRPEVLQTTMGVDNLRCTRGDRVLIAHDVMLVGYCSGRIKSVATNGDGHVTAVTVDEACLMEADGSYALSFRLANGTVQTQPVQAVAGAQTTLTFTTPISIGKPIGGELFSFGESGAVTEDMIITRIEPRSDLTAQVTMRHYAPGVHTADQGGIPAFETSITRPPSLQKVPPKPIILGIRSDESLLVQAGSSLRPRINVAFDVPQSIFVSGTWLTSTIAEYVQAQIRRSGSGEAWGGEISVPAAARSVMFDDGIEAGTTYDIRLRSVSPLSVASDWTVLQPHTVIGQSSPPPSIDGLLVESGLLVWAYPSPPVDFAGFRVRYHYGDNAHWESAAPAHDGLLTTAQFPLERLGGSGVRTVMVHAYDLSGNQSAVPAVVRLDLGNQVLRSILTTREYEAEGFPGEVEGGAVVGETLEADSTSIYWNSNENAPHWSENSAHYWGGAHSNLSYVADYVPSASALDGNIVLELNWAGTGGSVSYRGDSRAAYWSGDDSARYWKSDTAANWSPRPDWSPYPGRIGALVRQRYQFRLMITGGSTQPVVTRFWVHLDVPDLLETLTGIVVPAEGLRLPITQTYRTIQSVQPVLIEDGGTAVRVRVKDKDVSGPLVDCVSSAGTAVEGLIDVTIKGN